jgi:hypothetical protein
MESKLGEGATSLFTILFISKDRKLNKIDYTQRDKIKKILTKPLYQKGRTDD